MSGAVHTPGPWQIIGADPAEGWDGFHIMGQPNAVMRGFTMDIASVHGSQRDPSRAANARLIAAAPELLDALNEALTLMRGEPDMSLPGSDHWLWAKSARTAIARAHTTSEGEG